MYIAIIFIALAGLVGVIWLYRKSPKSSKKFATKEKQSDGVRRINAKEREPLPFKENLHTSQSGNEKRRFFFDVKLRENGKKFMTISELEKEVGGDKAYRIVLFEHEIEGFKKAFERSYEFMKGKDK